MSNKQQCNFQKIYCVCYIYTGLRNVDQATTKLSRSSAFHSEAAVTTVINKSEPKINSCCYWLRGHTKSRKTKMFSF